MNWRAFWKLDISFALSITLYVSDQRLDAIGIGVEDVVLALLLV